MNATLELFIWAFIVFMLLLVLLPYLFRRADLMTSWNLFILGSVNFLGFSTFLIIHKGHHYVEHTSRDYTNYILGMITFFTVLIITYYVGKSIPKWVAGKTLRKWPPKSPTVIFLLLPLFTVFMVGRPYLTNIPFAREFFNVVGGQGGTITFVLLFVAWWKNRKNPVFLVLCIAAFMFAMVFAIRGSSGRRTMVGMLMAIPIYLYWDTLRYKKPALVLGMAVPAAFAVIMWIGAYSHLRHFSLELGGKQRTLESAYEILLEIPERISTGNLGILGGGDCASAAFATIHLYTHGGEKTEPFFATYFVAVNPIPRAVWSGKPVGLGATLPRRLGVDRTTWGPGIVGHGFHEGGLHMLVYYGIVFGFLLRWFDELLVQQSDNPYLMVILSLIAAHVFAWPRGDIGVMGIEIIGAFLAVLVPCWIGRMVFGSKLVYPKPDSQPTQNRDAQIALQGRTHGR